MRLVFGLLALLLALSPAPALADSTTEGQVDLARRHFLSGSAYFEEGRFDEAAREFQESYHLAPRVDLLYNIAQCFLRKGDAARAVEFFDLYLDGNPAAKDRASIERITAELRTHVGRLRIDGAPVGSEIFVGGARVGVAPLTGAVAATAGKVRIEARLGDGSVRSLVATVQPEEETRVLIPAPVERVVVQEKVVERIVERSGPRWWSSKPGWAVAAVGAALVIGGGLMVGPIASAVGDGATSATTESAWLSVRSNMDTVRAVGIGALVAGVAAIGVGVTLFALKERPEAPRVTLNLAPASPSLQMAWSF